MAGLIAHDGTSFELVAGENLIGRGERENGDDPPTVNLGPVDDGVTVSRRHARVVNRAGTWYLQVMPEAHNATRVDGYVVPNGEEVSLADQSSIQLGAVKLRFVADRADNRQTGETCPSRSFTPLWSVAVDQLRHRFKGPVDLATLKVQIHAVCEGIEQRGEIWQVVESVGGEPFYMGPFELFGPALIPPAYVEDPEYGWPAVITIDGDFDVRALVPRPRHQPLLRRGNRVIAVVLARGEYRQAFPGDHRSRE